MLLHRPDIGFLQHWRAQHFASQLHSGVYLAAAAWWTPHNDAAGS